MARASRFPLLMMLSIAACTENLPPEPEATSICRASTVNDLQEIADGDRLKNCFLELVGTQLENLAPLSAEDAALGFEFNDNPILDDISGISGIAAEMLHAERTSFRMVSELPAAIPDILVVESEIETPVWEAASGETLAFIVAPQLRTLSAPNLTSLGALIIEGAPNLSSLAEAFPSLTTLQTLRIRDCPLLAEEDIDALANLVTSSTGVELCGNTGDPPCSD